MNTVLSAHESPLANALSAATDALLSGNNNLDSIFARYGVSRRDVEPIIRVLNRLHRTLVGVQPSRRFVRRLQIELVGQPEPGWFGKLITRGLIGRVRYLPARVQIAAGVVFVAGFMLLARRRLSLDALAEAAELAAGLGDVPALERKAVEAGAAGV